MSKEITNRIKQTETEAKAIVEAAEMESEQMIRNIGEKISIEKAELSSRLKREYNERILRCELQCQKMQEEAESAAKITAEKYEEKYKEFFEEAVSSVMKVFLDW